MQMNDVIQISSGQSFSIVLNKVGKVYSFGRNEVFFFIKKGWTTWLG
jgi:alpha-tubulin suppressor-like RCC1 family protein